MSVTDKYMDAMGAMEELIDELHEVTQEQREALIERYDKRGIPVKFKYGEVTNDDMWVLHMRSDHWLNMKYFLGFEYEYSSVGVLFDDKVNGEVLVMYHIGSNRVDNFMDMLLALEEVTE